MAICTVKYIKQLSLKWNVLSYYQNQHYCIKIQDVLFKSILLKVLSLARDQQNLLHRPNNKQFRLAGPSAPPPASPTQGEAAADTM